MPKSSQPIEWNVGEEQFSQASAASGHYDAHGSSAGQQSNRTSFYRVASWVAILTALFMATRFYFSTHESTSPQSQEPSSLLVSAEEPVAHSAELPALEQQAIQEILNLQRSMELGPQLAKHVDAQSPTTVERSSTQSLVDIRHGGEVDPAILGLQRKEFLLDVKVTEPLAIATILVENPNDEQWHYGAYQERRFFQREGAKWRWADPKEHLQGQPQWIETVHLKFEFQELERAYFLAIADEMEAAHVRLRKLVDPTYSGKEFRPAEPSRLSTPESNAAEEATEEAKLTLVSVPRDVPGLIGAGARQKIASPLVGKRPTNFSEEEWLSQRVIERLVHLEVRKYVTTKVGMDYHRWDLMGTALNGWLQRELLGRRSPWHAEAAAKFQLSRFTDAPQPLTVLFTTDPMGWPSRSERMQNYMLAETMIEYAVQTYGIGKVGDLLQGLSIYYTWGELIPAVFDVPVEEFETGWNEYLRNQL